MLISQRKRNIIDLLGVKSFCKLDELAEKLGTSVSTVRRELNELEGQGIVKRTHGGVMFLGEQKTLPVFVDRQNSMAGEKRLIGSRAAELVEDGDTIIVDGGTTPYQVAMNLRGKNVHIVTNSLPVTNLFADSQNVQILSTGGVLYPGTGVYLGENAINTLRSIKAQKAFIGVAGITEDGLYNSNALVVETERAILDSAGEIYVVSDHTKFGRSALALLAGFENITAILTTRPVSDEQKGVVGKLSESIEIIFAGE
jgi:DeoR family transcriptional regulator, fructose operon transcriptional repressor